MSQFRTSRAGRLTGLVLSAILGLAMVMMAGGFASTANAAEPVEVAHTAAGDTMTSMIAGSTANGRAVSGSFTPLKFTKKDGRILVRGVVNGVVTNADNSTKTFTTIRTFKVKKLNGVPVRNARAINARATCDILHLVLGPLDLNLLGLVVHLDKVVLDIVAVSGAGALLGNLLCAVAGLLDGGLGGLLGRLTALLNQILGQLGLGL
jgi:hypothetical protein